MARTTVIVAIFLILVCVHQLVKCPDPTKDPGLMAKLKDAGIGVVVNGLNLIAGYLQAPSNLPKKADVIKGIQKDGSEIALSMSGSAFLLGYHFGVAEAYLKLAKNFFRKIKYFAGTSGGSLVAMLLAYCDQNDAELKQCQDLINHAMIETAKLVKEMNSAGNMGMYCTAGIWMYDSILAYITKYTPGKKIADYSVYIMRSCVKKGYPLFEKLEEILERVVPQGEEDFKRIKKNRLFISMSKLEIKKSLNKEKLEVKKVAHKVSEYRNRDHQIRCNLASSFIDVIDYMGVGVQPPEIDEGSNVRYVDGFYTDQLPLVTIPGKDVWTMTVSPFAAEAVIHPPDKVMKYVFELNVFRLYVTKENIYRIGDSAFPTLENLMAYRTQGFKHAMEFLAENKFTDTEIQPDQYEDLIKRHIKPVNV